MLRQPLVVTAARASPALLFCMSVAFAGEAVSDHRSQCLFCTAGNSGILRFQIQDSPGSPVEQPKLSPLTETARSALRCQRLSFAIALVVAVDTCKCKGHIEERYG